MTPALTDALEAARLAELEAVEILKLIDALPEGISAAARLRSDLANLIHKFADLRQLLRDTAGEF